MKILVTGATGFIGSHFVQNALACGHDIVALKHHADSQPRIKLTHQPNWLGKGMHEIREEDLRGCDVLVHLAAVGVSPRTDTWESLMRWNVVESVQLAERAWQAGVSRWVVAGTFAEYGLAALRFKRIPVDAPLEPTSPYAASKAAASVLFQTLARSVGAELFYLRIFSAFGEGQYAGNLWPSLRQAAFAGNDFEMTPAEQIRDFVPVEKVAESFLDACRTRCVNAGQPVVANLGTGQPQTLRQFAEHWWAKWQATGKLLFGAHSYREGEVMRFVPEVTQFAFE